MQVLEKLGNHKGVLADIGPIDYYWPIGGEGLYGPYQDAEHLTLGQLTDDLEEIRKIANCDSGPVALGLAKASAVWRRLGIGRFGSVYDHEKRT